MSQAESHHVMFKKINEVGVILINRPKALNALDMDMVVRIWNQLLEWENNATLILIKGAGNSFCAGGDLKQDYKKTHSGLSFGFIEYNLNYFISTLSVPYVALIDGFTMGGGLGVSVHGKYRVATENTVAAMPETKVGLITDVGGSYFLPRLPFHLGYYMALTSAKIKGEDTYLAGIATHFVPSEQLPGLEESLLQCKSAESVKEVLARFHQEPKKSALRPHLRRIDYCFAASTVEDIIKRLEAADDQWCTQTAAIIRGMCPISLKLTLEALQRGAKLNLWHCLVMEHRLIFRLSQENNFREGVRALLINKDNKPKWIPQTLEEITEADVFHYFEPLPKNYELNRLGYFSKL